MLRALLADRFKLAVHFEDRPMTAYTLTAPKPKLKKADAATRTKWSDSSGPIALNGSSVPSRTIKFQNMSMAQLAEKLQYLGSAYIHAPVSRNPKAKMPGFPEYDDATLAALTAYFQTFSRQAKQ